MALHTSAFRQTGTRRRQVEPSPVGWLPAAEEVHRIPSQARHNTTEAVPCRFNSGLYSFRSVAHSREPSCAPSPFGREEQFLSSSRARRRAPWTLVGCRALSARLPADRSCLKRAAADPQSPKQGRPAAVIVGHEEYEDAFDFSMPEPGSWEWELFLQITGAIPWEEWLRFRSRSDTAPEEVAA